MIKSIRTYGCALLAITIMLVQVQAYSMPYQAHSFNDIDAWPQLLAKQVQWFKVDFVIVTQDSCVANSNWKLGDNPCQTFNNQSYCCIGLRGDTSSAPKLNNPFNTTNDLLKFLQAPENQAFLTDPSHPIHVAMDLDHMVNWDRWNDSPRLLFISFFTQLQAIITQHKLAFVPTLDSFANDWFVSADVACQKTCTADQATLSALPFPAGGEGFPATTDDPKGRYQILNAAWGDFNGICSSSFPLANRTDKYPYLMWEPSTQADIDTMVTEFQKCSAVPASHQSLETGLRVTCNQDPEMFSVFSSNLLKRGLNNLYVNSINATNPRMTVVPAMTGASYDAFLVVIYTSATNQQIMEVTGFHSTFPSTGLDPRANGTLLASVTLQVPTVISLSFAESGVDKAILLLNTESGLFKAYSLSRSSGQLSDYVSGAWPALTSVSNLYQGASVMCSSATCFVMVTEIVTGFNASAPAPCQLFAHVASLTAGSVAFAQSQCLAKNVAVHNASISLASVSSTSFAGLLSYSSVETSSNINSINSIVLQVDVTSSSPLQVKITYEDGTSAAASLPPRWDYGSMPSVFAYNFQGVVYALEVHTDGTCQFGFAINNGDYNHCNIAIQGNPAGLASIPGLINYNFGSLSSLEAQLMSRVPASSCSRHVVHGKFDGGVSPSAALFPSAAGDELLLLELHDAGSVLRNGESPLLTGICGAPNLSQGLTLDAFNLPTMAALKALNQQ